MNTILTLTHITDVGSPSGDGSDSTERIARQYQRLGIPLPRVVSAGQSPLHVAFTACTDVSARALNAVDAVLQNLNIHPPQQQPVALNSAPRNEPSSHEKSKAGYIYRVRHPNHETLLVYGDEVISWVLAFRGRIGVAIEAIKEINLGNHRIDTSNGSQFRSAEHLPITHFLEATGNLDRFASDIDPIPTENFPNHYPTHDQEAVVAPPDEYENGRLIVTPEQRAKVLQNTHVRIDGIAENEIAVRQSLTEVIPGELSIWPSSNYFQGEGTLEVLNLGTRWAQGQTRTTDEKIIQLSRILSRSVGDTYKFS